VFESPRALLVMTVCIALACCAPASPEGIPNDARAEWSLKSDWVWRWTPTLQSGCVAWRAKESWASVRLSTDAQECEAGPYLSYFTSSDRLVFRDYWPNDDEPGTFFFDGEGMISGIRPCSHSISPEQLAALRTVVREALAQATTNGERRTLRRIDQRLEATNGAALASAQFGCTDGSLELTHRPVRVDNVWRVTDQP
jgi:hypothetical protein